MEVNGQLSCFVPGERDSSAHLVGGWMGLTASPDTGEEKNLLFLLEIKPHFLSVQPLPCMLSFPILAPLSHFCIILDEVSLYFLIQLRISLPLMPPEIQWL